MAFFSVFLLHLFSDLLHCCAVSEEEAERVRGEERARI